MESAARVFHSAWHARAQAALGAVPLRDFGAQAASGDYATFEYPDESREDGASDKDSDANGLSVTINLYGSSPLALMEQAADLITAMTWEPLTVTGFYPVRARLEMNRARSLQDVAGAGPQYARDLRFAFILNPRS